MASEATLIHRLPDEISVQIFSSLLKRDVKEARLTCTRWANVGAQWLFERVYVAPRRSAMKDLASIAADQRFSLSVKELIYDARLFLPQMTHPSRYRAAYDEELDWNEYLINQRIESLQDNSYVNSLYDYTCLLEEQRTLLRDWDEQADLAKSMRAFSNATRVIVSDNFRENRLIHDDLGWYELRSSSHFRRALGPAFSHDMHVSYSVLGDDDQNDFNAFDFCREARGVRHFLSAVGSQCNKVKSLQIGTEVSYDPLVRFTMFEGCEGIKSMMRKLTYLKFYCKGIDGESLDHPNATSLTHFLDCGEQLRSLQADGFRHIDAFLGVQLPHLTSLKFSNGHYWPAHQLIEILRSYKDHLRKLVLDTVKLQENGDFDNVGKTIGQFLRLNHVCILLGGNEEWGLSDSGHVTFVRDVMQWVPRGKLVIERPSARHCLGKLCEDLDDPSDDPSQHTSSLDHMVGDHDGYIGSKPGRLPMT